MSKKQKTHRLATISLAVMGIGFISTIPLQNSLFGALLQGGFEAGLVGGLADWFAVTALFRHPLGVPIPHTALLPKNRNKITAAIISMLENDWLTKDSIRKKIDDIPLMEKLFSLADKEMGTPAFQKNIIKALQHIINQVKTERIAPLLEKELKSQLNKLEIKDYLPNLIDQLTIRKYDEKVLDYLLNEIEDWAEKESTKERLGRMAVEAIENIKADGFMQFALKSFSNLVNEEKLGNIIQSLIHKGVTSYRDPFNQNRQTLLFHVHSKLRNLKSDEKLYEELDAFKRQSLSEWDPNEKIVTLLNQLQEKMIQFVEEPVFFDEYLFPLLNNGLKELKENTNKVNEIETWIKKQISKFVEKNHSKVGKLVKENLDKLDDKTLINMIENNIGKDLQWIRVNGAVCGFFIGLFLVGVRMLF